MNKAFLQGFLGQDPETREVNQTSVTNFSMATSERYTDKNGEKQTVTTWHRVVAWGKQGEVIAKYFKKGDPILVTGSIQKRDYEDKEGQKRQAVDIKLDGFEFVPQKKVSNQDADADVPERPDVPNMAPSFDTNEEIPF